jgi:Rrf2 family protein
MPLLPRKSLLAIAAVTDIAFNARNGPVTGKALTKRHHLPARHLEPVLQALTRKGILKAVRGPHGGYVLAREQRRITASDILRAAGTVDDESEEPVSGSALLIEVVGPALVKAANAFSNALSRISVEDLARSAAALRARKGK